MCQDPFSEETPCCLILANDHHPWAATKTPHFGTSLTGGSTVLLLVVVVVIAAAAAATAVAAVAAVVLVVLVGDNNILLACRSAECSYELWCTLTSTWGESNPLTSVSIKTLKIITFLRILAGYKECQFPGSLLFLLRIPAYLHLPVSFAMKQFSY